MNLTDTFNEMVERRERVVHEAVAAYLAYIEETTPTLSRKDGTLASSKVELAFNDAVWSVGISFDNPKHRMRALSAAWHATPERFYSVKV